MLAFAMVFRRLGRAVRRGFADPGFRGVLYLALTLLAIGAVFFARAEDWTVFQGLYFSVITLTTVGYGDLAPVTAAGRGFAMVYVLIGIGVIVTLATQIAHHAVEDARSRKPGED